MTGRGVVGTGAVVAVVVTVGLLLADVPGSRTLVRRLSDRWRGLGTLSVTFDERQDLRPGDPVYSVEGASFALQGRVAAVEGPPWTVVCEVDPLVLRRFTEGTKGVAMDPDDNLAWMARTLVPPPLRERLLEDLRRTWEEHREETLAALTPHLELLAGDLLEILKDTLPDALARHEEERNRFFAVFTEEVLEEDLSPLLEEEFASRLEDRLTPLASELGRDVVNAIRLSEKLSFGWTALFGSDTAKEQEFQNIVERRVLPELRKRAPELFQEAVAAVREGLEDPDVRERLDAALRETVEHEAFRDFAGSVLRTWLIENESLRRRLLEGLRSPDFRRPLEALWEAVEPRLEEFLEEILSRPDREGMDHQLVRVLRRLVLNKDKRYVLLRRAESGDPLGAGAVIAGVPGRDP